MLFPRIVCISIGHIFHLIDVEIEQTDARIVKNMEAVGNGRERDKRPRLRGGSHALSRALKTTSDSKGLFIVHHSLQ